MGGKLVLNAEVDEIETTDRRVTGVRLKNGQRFDTQVVVSNADVVHTYDKLLRRDEDAKPVAKKLKTMRHSMSLFLIYFGTKKTYPNIAHHTVIFGPRYRELLKDIFKTGKLADDFSLYLHAPTRTDSDLAPEGCEAFYVLSPVPHLGKNDLDWKVEGPRYAQRILDYLDQHHLPGLKENLVTQRIFTPEDFKTELNAHWGSAFSLEPILTQSAYFRAKNRDAKIEGMYIVGAGTHPGAGLPGVINSAKATVSVVKQDWEGELAPVPPTTETSGLSYA
jgi:phytoene desaturase